MDLDGIQAVFLLQPLLVLSHKPFTDSERRLSDYDRRLGGPLYVYTFEQLYSVIARDMAAAADKDGFRFLSLQDLFDQTPQQAFSDFAHLTPQANQMDRRPCVPIPQDSFTERARTTK